MFKRFAALLLTAILVFSIFPSNELQAAETKGQFTDTKGHWAESTIAWAVGQGIVQGYDSGSFLPDVTVSEPEFLAMFLRAFHAELPEITNQQHWADRYYAFAKDKNYPLNGYDSKNRNWMMGRATVAELISAADGYNLLYLAAVRYVLAKGYATGSDPGNITIENFHPEQTLTRAEAVTFIYKLQQSGFNKLKKNPSERSSTENMPEAFYNFNPQGAAIYKVLKGKFEGSDTYRVHYDYDFDRIEVWKTSKDKKTIVETNDGLKLQVPEITRDVIVDFEVYTGTRRIYLGNNNQETLDLGITILNAVGYNLDKSYASVLNQVYTTGQTYSDAGIKITKTNGLEIFF